ncbi:hypothetical protein CK203_052367 [Vitis vinifera]|uniref:Retrotransposon gag domain-containing protein n=1 Tax=Vitis vinifera TaxID=29760 RepID=A0A438H399_VITVI|nr:hypothetical protein CK203_052367 [Vitis vinifera]
MSNELASTLASIQEFMAGVSRRLDWIESSRQDHYLINISTNETVPRSSQTTQDGGLTWDDRDGIPAASLLAKFHMPDIERYSGIGCPKIPLRLYNTVMRAHEIDDAQLEDVAHEFLTRFSFNADIDVSIQELEATRQRLDEPISSFVSRWRAKDLKSLVHAAFSVEEAIARRLWTDTAHFPDSKGKKMVGSSSRSGEVDTISYQHQRPAPHSPYRPPIVRAHLSYPQYQYHPVYVQQSYIAQTSMQPRPPHQRVTILPPPKPYT